MHWGDIAIHGAIAIGIVAMLGAVGAQWLAAGGVSIGFLAREEIQGMEKYATWLTPWQWSMQKLAEGFVPVFAAVLVALAWRHWLNARRKSSKLQRHGAAHRR